jgi:putative chitinase
MIKYKAIKDTWLKKENIQAVELPNNKKVFVSKGKVYKILNETEVINSDSFEIDLSDNGGRWFIHIKDWDVDRIVSTPLTVSSKIDWYDMNQPVSRFFTVREVTNNDVRRVPNTVHQQNVLRLAKELDLIRDKYGALRITSWMRPSKQDGYLYDINKAVGGSSLSQHRTGLAVDLYPINYPLSQFQSEMLNTWRGAVGKGVSKGFVHLDARYGFPCFNKGNALVAWNY